MPMLILDRVDQSSALCCLDLMKPVPSGRHLRAQHAALPVAMKHRADAGVRAFNRRFNQAKCCLPRITPSAEAAVLEALIAVRIAFAIYPFPMQQAGERG